MGDAPFKAGIFLLPYLIGQMVASWISVSLIFHIQSMRTTFTPLMEGMLVSITGKYRVRNSAES
jgi:hypothetical protein